MSLTMDYHLGVTRCHVEAQPKWILAGIATNANAKSVSVGVIDMLFDLDELSVFSTFAGRIKTRGLGPMISVSSNGMIATLLIKFSLPQPDETCISNVRIYSREHGDRSKREKHIDELVYTSVVSIAPELAYWFEKNISSEKPGLLIITDISDTHGKGVASEPVTTFEFSSVRKGHTPDLFVMIDTDTNR